MAKALQCEAVERLLQALNNAGHESVPLALRVKSFQNTNPYASADYAS